MYVSTLCACARYVTYYGYGMEQLEEGRGVLVEAGRRGRREEGHKPSHTQLLLRCSWL